MPTKDYKKLVTRLQDMEEIDWVMLRAVVQIMRSVQSVDELTPEQDAILQWLDTYYDCDVQRGAIALISKELEAEQCPK